ncbi:hypothetical protein PIROE2DRAFT_7949 [Piromyces sp. E2]|nr:hypothetical protein PIROE2DRAFT_7949 [Piromyces sp. E2]|eukprot:OUM65139.1 hypothetical protein PIROE2DRAFT_7949 [Piromyces sp. E2]
MEKNDFLLYINGTNSTRLHVLPQTDIDVTHAIGDWYPLIRTQAVIKNKKSLKSVYWACIFHTIVKILLIIQYFIHLPMDLRYTKEGDKKVWDYINVVVLYNILLITTLLTSFLYDLSVIRVLNKNIFKKNKRIKEGSFLDRFKRLSEYRIYYSMIATVIIIPFFGLGILANYGVCLSAHGVCNLDVSIDFIYDIVSSINCNIMYIDQILLRIYYYQAYGSGNKNAIICVNNSSSDGSDECTQIDGHRNKSTDFINRCQIESTYYLNELENLNPTTTTKDNEDNNPSNPNNTDHNIKSRSSLSPLIHPSSPSNVSVNPISTPNLLPK